MTTRRFPRTADEAFPGSARYAAAVERPARRHSPIAMIVALLLTIVIALTLVA